MTLTYKDLTDQDAILLLKYEIGAFALNRSCGGVYEDANALPRPTPDPTDLLMSYLLQVDFRKDIYDKFGNKPSRWKAPDSVEFIGDQLRGIVWDRVMALSRVDIIRVDKGLLDELQNVVAYAWINFKKHYNLEEFATLTTPSCQYIQSGVIVNGEMLYKRVEEKK